MGIEFLFILYLNNFILNKQNKCLETLSNSEQFDKFTHTPLVVVELQALEDSS